MRYIILIALIMISSSAVAQDNWSQAVSIYDQSWEVSCDLSGGYGFYSPSVTSNDSMLFFIAWCFNGHM